MWWSVSHPTRQIEIAIVRHTTTADIVLATAVTFANWRVGIVMAV
jgi:hypothetical protein